MCHIVYDTRPPLARAFYLGAQGNAEEAKGSAGRALPCAAPCSASSRLVVTSCALGAVEGGTPTCGQWRAGRRAPMPTFGGASALPRPSRPTDWAATPPSRPTDWPTRGRRRGAATARKRHGGGGTRTAELSALCEEGIDLVRCALCGCAECHPVLAVEARDVFRRCERVHYIVFPHRRLALLLLLDCQHV